MYDAGLVEYKKISRVPFFNDKKTGKFTVSISVSTSWVVYSTRETMRYNINITLKTRNETGNETTMTLVLPIYKYNDIDHLKYNLHFYLFKSDKDEYTFDFPNNGSFFDGIIAKSTDLLNKFKEEQKELEEEKKRRKRVEAVWYAINDMHFYTYLYQSSSYNRITNAFQRWMKPDDVTEYERFKTEQITRAEEEKRLINGTEYHDTEKDNRILLVDAILNRILRTKLLLMLTSHFINEFELQKNEAIEVLKPTDKESYVEYEEGNTLLQCIIKKMIEMQDRKEEQEGLIKNMIEQMKKIHSERVESELDFKIIEEELIGTNHDGVWTRDMGWAVLRRDILFIPPWN